MIDNDQGAYLLRLQLHQQPTGKAFEQELGAPHCSIIGMLALEHIRTILPSSSFSLSANFAGHACRRGGS